MKIVVLSVLAVAAITVAPSSAQNRCLPWLERQLGLILDQLKRLGSQGFALPEQRQHLPIEQFVKDVVDELKEAERLLAQILKVR